MPTYPINRTYGEQRYYKQAPEYLDVSQQLLLNKQLKVTGDTLSGRSPVPGDELDIPKDDRDFRYSREEGLQDPWIDPVSAFSGGFGGATTGLLKAGIPALKAVGRGIASGVSGAVADYPLGALQEHVIAPNVQGPLQFPVAMATGMISGHYLEPKLTAGVLKAGQTLGKIGSQFEPSGYAPGSRLVMDDKGEILAFHGSPHKVDKFSTKKIGTGEGAQAFGWGLYFTSEKEIAKHYAKTKTGWIVNLAVDGEMIPTPNFNNFRTITEGTNLYGDIGRYLRAKKDGNVEGEKIARNWIEYRLNNYRNNKTGSENLEPLFDFYEKTKNITPDRIKESGENIYSVTLHKGKQPGEYDYLKWDEPVSEPTLSKIEVQAKKERLRIVPANSLEDGFLITGGGKLRIENTETGTKYFLEHGNSKFRLTEEDAWRLVGKEGSGENLYQVISRQLGSDREASLFLLRAGIDGIEYPAGSLSGKKSSARNYVVFDENAVTINPDKERGSISFAKSEGERGPGGMRKIPVDRDENELIDMDGKSTKGIEDAGPQLKVAKFLSAKGLHPKKIKARTGWSKSPSGEWEKAH